MMLSKTMSWNPDKFNHREIEFIIEYKQIDTKEISTYKQSKSVWHFKFVSYSHKKTICVWQDWRQKCGKVFYVIIEVKSAAHNFDSSRSRASNLISS